MFNYIFFSPEKTLIYISWILSYFLNQSLRANWEAMSLAIVFSNPVKETTILNF